MNVTGWPNLIPYINSTPVLKALLYIFFFLHTKNGCHSSAILSLLMNFFYSQSMIFFFFFFGQKSRGARRLQELPLPSGDQGIYDPGWGLRQGLSHHLPVILK